MDNKSVPFVDLYKQYLTIKDKIDEAISDVIASSSFVRGPHVEKFEDLFAQAIGTKHCISCANGTDALYIAMKALGLENGGEVIAPAHTWISTTETITQAGGQVVFCDTRLDTFLMDVEQIEAQITPKTVGIIPVHLFGHPADMDAIMALAKKHNFWVLEDCAQAHLAKYKGQKVGTFGDIATFSFYPGKNLGAMGDAGAILTNNDKLAENMTMFCRHGGLKKGDHVIEGINSRMDGLQAAILNIKLPKLATWTKLRQAAAAKYTELLGSIEGLEAPSVAEGCEHVWHLYVIKIDDRDGLKNHLKSENIQTVINYPIALPFLPAYEKLGHRSEDFPNAYKNQSKILSLPIFGEITEHQIGRVCESIKSFIGKNKT